MVSRQSHLLSINGEVGSVEVGSGTHNGELGRGWSPKIEAQLVGHITGSWVNIITSISMYCTYILYLCYMKTVLNTIGCI